MNDNTKKRRNLHYVFYSLTLILGLWLGFFLSPVNQDSLLRTSPSKDQIDKITDILRYIEENYVDSVEFKKLTENALVSILLHLDPHSTYIPLEEFKLISDQMSGNFEGIGVQFRIVEDTVYVVQTIANGPSEKVGVKAGDRIIEINGKNYAGIGITNNEIMKLLRGEKGTKVVLGINRKGVSGITNYTITRDVIPTKSIDFSGMINEEIGYIKLSSFNFNSHLEFAEALKKLNDQGMTKLIFDLRGNVGGSFEACIRIADHFFDRNVLLVYTKGLHRARSNHYSTKKGLFEKGDLVILVDGFSASASEIIAGAVQDNERGTIIGRRTFGKGLVQEQIPFSDGSAIRLTVARYYTPLGRSIQRKYERGTVAYYKDFYNRMLDEYETRSDTTIYDTIQFRTKSGKILYAGGGIMPDIRVDFPELYKNDSLNVYLSMLFPFSFEFADKNRQLLLNTFSNCEEFIKGFQITQEIWNQYLTFIRKNNQSKKNVIHVILTPEEKTFFEVKLKAIIGRNIFDFECYYPIAKETDEVLKTAIEFLSEK